MSWYTAGEIVVWLLLAAVLGGALGWLLRGMLRPPRTRERSMAVADDAPPRPPRTRVSEIDTGASGTTAAGVGADPAPLHREASGSDPVA